MLTCNAFEAADLTLTTTQQEVACFVPCDNLQEPEDDVFYYLVIDALSRLGVSPGSLLPADVSTAVENARCVTEINSVPTLNYQNAKGIILTQLNELLCAE